MIRNRFLPFLYVSIVTILVAATAVIVSRFSNATVAALLFLLWTGLATRLWGLAPGILAAVAAFLAFNFFFIDPKYTLAVHQTEDLLVLLVFLLAAVAINQLVGQIRGSLADSTAREREATRLFELSQMLARAHDETSAIQVLAQKMLETFSASQVEVWMDARDERPARQVRVGGKGDLPGGEVARPVLILALQSAQGLIGELRLWRGGGQLTPGELRLANIIAGQGSLALERARLAHAENRARLLEDSDRLKTALLSSVSHDLRTPLATIKASVSSLRSGAVQWESDARSDLLAAIEEETDALNSLVGNLLDMSRIEAGALRPDRKWNSLREILSRVVARSDAVRGRVRVDFPDDLPLAPVDFVQIERVFDNLLNNSIKYSPAGTPVIFRARRQNEQFALVSVENQSPPLAPEDLDRIFEKFHRVTSADRITGAGLGLSICKGIIEAHGGRIWAENLPVGIAFRFTLPLNLEGASPRLPTE